MIGKLIEACHLLQILAPRVSRLPVNLVLKWRPVYWKLNVYKPYLLITILYVVPVDFVSDAAADNGVCLSVRTLDDIADDPSVAITGGASLLRTPLLKWYRHAELWFWMLICTVIRICSFWGIIYFGVCILFCLVFTAWVHAHRSGIRQN